MRGDTMNEYTLKLSAKDIFEKEFEKSLRGFKPIEVDSFLDDVISDYQKMADMNSNLKRLEEENARLKKEVEELRIRVATNSRSVDNQAQTHQIDILKRLSNLEKKVFGQSKVN
jgi:DivIVA domain-containing protein|tara:strand:- start:570 stop:911 length:342 start_codon:yes stop_codon:yes gene_type:complete